MPLAVKITSTRKGPILRLSLAITSDSKCNAQSDSVTSDIYDVDDLAKIRLKISYYSSVQNRTYISTMKNKLIEDAEIKMNVTCVPMKYSESWTCSDGWTDFLRMGETISGQVTTLPDYTYVYLSVFEIRISVHKIYKPSYIKLYKDSDFTDFNLSTPDGVVAVHKAFLAAHSDVLKTMFTGKWKETNENMMEMKGYSLETVKQMKDFLYLGTLPDNETDLCSLMALAAQYCFADLKAECSRKMVQIVSSKNLQSVHELACKNNLPELSYALMELTPDEVVNQSHEIKKQEAAKIKQIGEGSFK